MLVEQQQAKQPEPGVGPAPEDYVTRFERNVDAARCGRTTSAEFPPRTRAALDLLKDCVRA